MRLQTVLSAGIASGSNISFLREDLDHCREPSSAMTRGHICYAAVADRCLMVLMTFHTHMFQSHKATHLITSRARRSYAARLKWWQSVLTAEACL